MDGLSLNQLFGPSPDEGSSGDGGQPPARFSAPPPPSARGDTAGAMHNATLDQLFGSDNFARYHRNAAGQRALRDPYDEPIAWTPMAGVGKHATLGCQPAYEDFLGHFGAQAEILAMLTACELFYGSNSVECDELVNQANTNAAEMEDALDRVRAICPSDLWIWVTGG